MAGVTSILETVRREVALLRSQMRNRIGLQETRMDEMEARLDKLDKPANTQTGAIAKKTAKKQARSKGKAAKPSAEKRKVPAPPKPDELKGKAGAASS